MIDPYVPGESEVTRAEANAPVDQSGPLPLRVETLAYVPEDRRAQYVRDMTGAFRLAYIHEDDAASRLAHIEALAGGKVTVLPPGATPASLAAAAEQKAAMHRAVLEEVAALEAKAAQQRKDALARKHAAEIARHKAAMEAIK